jgi:hypothetical protein
MELTPISSYAFGSWTATLFTLFNMALAIILVLAFVTVFLKKPWLFLRPAILLAGIFTFILQLPLAVFAGYFEQQLGQPWHLSALVLSAILPGTVLVIKNWHRPAPATWAKLQTESSLHDLWSATVLVGACGLPLLWIYYSAVPFSCTAMHALFTDPFMVPIYREMSVKLIEPLLIRYAFAFYSLSVAMVIASLLMLIAGQYWQQRKYGKMALTVLLLIAVGLSGAVNGATANFLFGGVIAFITLAWKRGLRILNLQYVLFLALCMAPALTISLGVRHGTKLYGSRPETVEQQLPALRSCLAVLPVKKEAQDLHWIIGYLLLTPHDSSRLFKEAPENSPAPSHFSLYERSEMMHHLSRMFVSPIMVGAWFVDYTQRFGTHFWMIFPKLERLLEKSSPDLANIVGKFYGPAHYGMPVPPTINATTGFIFVNYASLGAWGLLLNLLLVCVWESLGFIARLFPPVFLPVFYAMVTFSSIFLVEAAFVTVVVLEGVLFALILLTCILLLKRIGKHRAKPR